MSSTFSIPLILALLILKRADIYANARYEIDSPLYLGLMFFHQPNISACLIMQDRPSMHIRKNKEDSGSPCQSPRVGLK